jgi:hypothetical protein
VCGMLCQSPFSSLAAMVFGKCVKGRRDDDRITIA